jgi:hypothetical protein
MPSDTARGLLFLTEMGGPFTPNQITKLVGDYITRADIGKNVPSSDGSCVKSNCGKTCGPLPSSRSCCGRVQE